MWRKISLVVAAALTYYFYLNWSQMSAAAHLCEHYAIGTQIDLAEVQAKTRALKAMGPLDLVDKPGTQRIIFCASATLCDTSCSLEMKDGRVTASTYTSL